LAYRRRFNALQHWKKVRDVSRQKDAHVQTELTSVWRVEEKELTRVNRVRCHARTLQSVFLDLQSRRNAGPCTSNALPDFWWLFNAT
jgi:hypothetical protein